MDRHRVVSWFLLFLFWIEWMGYYVHILLNFHRVRDIEGWVMLLYLAFFLSPTIAFVWSLLGRKVAQFLYRISMIIIPILLIIVITFLFLFYIDFYKLVENFNIPYSQLDYPTLIIGLNGELTPSAYFLFMICNGILFLGLMPWLLVYITHGTGIMHWEKELVVGTALFFFYMMIRWGSFMGTPFRLVILFLICIICWIIPANWTSPPSFQNTTSPIAPNSFFITIGLLISFLLAAPGISAQGFLNNSWIWGIGLIGSIGSLWFINKGKLISRPLIGIIIFIGLLGLVTLQILAQLIGVFLAVHDILLALGLLTISIFSIITPAWKNIFFNLDLLHNKPSLPSVIRLFFQWNCLGLVHLGFLFPMLSGTSDPISDIIILSIIGGFGFLMALRLIQAYKSKKLKNKSDNG